MEPGAPYDEEKIKLEGARKKAEALRTYMQYQQGKDSAEMAVGSPKSKNNTDDYLETVENSVNEHWKRMVQFQKQIRSNELTMLRATSHCSCTSGTNSMVPGSQALKSITRPANRSYRPKPKRNVTLRTGTMKRLPGT